MYRHLSTRNISSKSMHALLSNLTHRQTDRQTDIHTDIRTRACGRKHIPSPLSEANCCAVVRNWNKKICSARHSKNTGHWTGILWSVLVSLTKNDFTIFHVLDLNFDRSTFNMQRGDRRNRRGTFSSFAKENRTIFGTAKNDCGVQTEVHTHRPTSVALQNCTCLPVVITRLNKSSFSSISCDVGQIPFRYVFCSWSCLFHSNTYFLKVIQRRFATSFSISRWCLKLNLCVATVIFYRFRDIAT